jgi:hypothetical protein
MSPIKSLFSLLCSVLMVSILITASSENSLWAIQTEQDIEEFKELGEKAYYKKCTQGDVADILKDLFKSVGMDLKKVCKKNIAELKNITSTTSTAQPQSSSNSTTTPITYLTHYDYTNGFSVEFPSDWNLAGSSSFSSIGNDLMIYKGTRQFTLNIYNGSEYYLMDTDSFGSVYFDSYKEMDGIVITDSLARINLGVNDEAALTFSYSRGYYENMVTLLIHNNIGYAFKYTTLKQNSDTDFDTMMHLVASIRFL